MAVSIPVFIVIVFLHLLAFVLTIGAELHRSTAKVVQDQYLEYYYCLYTSNSSTTYGLVAFGLLLLNRTVVNIVTKGDKRVVRGCLNIFFFIISWVTFLGAEACLLGGSVKNTYHTKYRTIFDSTELHCKTLHKGVFAAGAAFVFLSMAGSLVYLWIHSIVDMGDWEKLQDERVPLLSSDFNETRRH